MKFFKSISIEILSAVSLLLISLALFVVGVMISTGHDVSFSHKTIVSNQSSEKTTRTMMLTSKETIYLNSLKEITVAPDPDWQPFEYMDKSGEIRGIARDFLDLIAARTGVTFKYLKPKDWGESLLLSKSGKAMILPFLNETEDRKKWLIFTEPLLTDPNVFISRQELPYIVDAGKIGQKTVVLPEGTSVQERVQREFPNLMVKTVADERQVFQAVSHGEADFAIRSLAVAAYTIRKDGLFNLKIAGQAPDQFTNYLRIGILKEESILRDILNKGIISITDEEREAIINRHINVTVVKPLDIGLLLRIAGIFGFLISMTLLWIFHLRKLNKKLRLALTEVKTLQGIIPICAGCKMIRDDKGYWEQVESYVSRMTNAQFSHGMCPDCLKKYYPEFYK